MATAGVTAGVTSAFNLPAPTANGATFGTRFTTYATQAMVGAGVKSLVYGQPLEETAKTALITALAQSLTSEIGDWAKANKIDPGSAGKIVAHAVVQCAAASIQNKDCGSAAIGAAVAEALSPALDAADQSDLSKNLKLNPGQLGNAIASMGALFAASLTGANAGTAMGSAQMVDAYNRQLHPDEIKRIKELAKGDKAAEDRLTRAACYEAKCWAEYPEGSAARAGAFVSVGESIDLAKEIALLQKEQQTSGLFTYTLTNKAMDDFKAGPLPVLQNVGKTVGGSLAVATGKTICGTTGAGCVVGGPLAMFGLSEVTDGATGLYNQYQGNGAVGFNPMRAGANTLWPTWGNTIYDASFLAASVLSLGVVVPAKVGFSDGINRVDSMFGVTVPKWQNPIINPLSGQILLPTQAAQGLAIYGVGAKVPAVIEDINKASGSK
jgi:filamentous hemagglutinin